MAKAEAKSGTDNVQVLRRQSLPEGTLRVLQLTDTHLYADTQAKLLGVNTLKSFESVIDEFKRHNWSPDLVLATGDLVHDASQEGYERLRDLLTRFDCPVACLPGNHDNPLIMRQALNSAPVTCPTLLDMKGWRIVLLDSVIPGAVGGRLADDQLDLLSNALDGHERPTLVALHHQPIPVGSDWIDNMGVENGDALMKIIRNAPHVHGLLWGHVHQRFDRQLGELRLMASPSTCVQFEPDSQEFSVEAKQPGFRLLALLPDGTLKTRVVRTPSVPNGLEVASAGY